MRSDHRFKQDTGSLRLYDIIAVCPAWFIADCFIWFIAHNLPLLIVLGTKEYFSNMSVSHQSLAVMWIAVLFIVRMLAIHIGAKVDIRCQQRWSEYLYIVIYEAVRHDHSHLSEGTFADGVNNDVSAIVSTLSYGIDTMCNVLYSVFAICILASIDYKLTLLILLFPCLSMLISMCLKGKVVAQTNLLKESENQFSQILIKLLADSRKIRIEGDEERVNSRVSSVLTRQRKNGSLQSAFTGVLHGLTTTLSELSLILILIYATHVPGILENGNIILFVSYTFDIAGAAQYVNSLVLILHQCVSYLDDFNSKYCLTGKNSSPPVQNKSAREFIEKVKRGNVNIMLGANGSGKTQAMLMLQKNLEPAFLLKQPIHLLNATIRENICLSDSCSPSVFDSIVEGVSLPASEFPDGYDTIVASQASNISDGQAFRIALARTIYAAEVCADNAYLLIDDNLLSVDEPTRLKILHYLKASQKTVIITDHEDRDAYCGCNTIKLDQSF